ncbi:hypothetical protein [Paenibacillus terrigena]|uniref:hypothetical protein n=1 Tax=Paenibacillus terrigena TaxID=369333 RepID=UPI0028D37067|nr:hypothetical protein [Paenibacillus terrigena]
MEDNQKQSFWKEEKGEISIKGIAITIGIIILVGMSITIIQGKMGNWLDDIWGIIKTQLEGIK